MGVLVGANNHMSLESLTPLCPLLLGIAASVTCRLPSRCLGTRCYYFPFSVVIQTVLEAATRMTF